MSNTGSLNNLRRKPVWNDSPTRIALTPGEPAGIGPDLCLLLTTKPRRSELVAVCDPKLLDERARKLGINIRLVDFSPDAPAHPNLPGKLSVLPVEMPGPVRCGELQPGFAKYVLQCLDTAIQGCQDGTFAAMVTGPVNKGVINAAGIPFSGHTEYLAQQTGAGQVVMMLTAPGIRVALATTHLPLSAVAAAITAEGLSKTLEVLSAELPRRLGIPHPRILVCGLNPHAGEGGHLGKEEIEVIIPTVERLCAQGMNLVGPVPADTAFTSHQLSNTDVVLAMYHDQGLPVLKHLGFGNAVNITLGLPIVRTSVDHGTAIELAGTGRANPGSMIAALQAAEQMAQCMPATL
ncbi:MAG: 4-hydroxythreonine-4-phosphate dehydrogenase PdxA [Gammaproteobacteria bacterium]